MIIGEECCWAIWTPVDALIAPGPRVTKQMPVVRGLADSFRHNRRVTGQLAMQVALKKETARSLRRHPRSVCLSVNLRNVGLISTEF